MGGLSLVGASGGLSLSRPLLLRSTGSRRAGSVVVAHGLSCSVACGIFPDQGSTPCPPHWQADSQPLRHQGSPATTFYRRNENSEELLTEEVRNNFNCHSSIRLILIECLLYARHCSGAGNIKMVKTDQKRKIPTLLRFTF